MGTCPVHFRLSSISDRTGRCTGKRPETPAGGGLRVLACGRSGILLRHSYGGRTGWGPRKEGVGDEMTAALHVAKGGPL